jgi:trehalose 6-phosphate phosphatase
MLPPLPRNAALFLDVDGTLLEIEARPEDVRADEALRRQLVRLAGVLDGAVAIVSGRSLADLDRIFAPLRPPAAGLHGAERRTSAGRVERVDVDAAALDRARAALNAYVGARPGLRLEDKGAALAVHCRGAPALEADLREYVGRLGETLGAGLHVQHGLLVCEIKPRGADKGTAVRAFMAEPPFAARLPVAVGDDLTDLDAFAAADALGGFGVSVGNRVAGRWQFPGPRELRAWLETFAERHGSAPSSGA